MVSYRFPLYSMSFKALHPFRFGQKIIRADNLPACFNFQVLSGITGNFATLTGSVFIFRKALGILFAGNLGGGTVYLSLFSVLGEKLKWGTDCTPVGVQLRIALTHPLYILARVNAVC